jgi:hypothetical protein
LSSYSADWSGINFPSNLSAWWKDLRGIDSAAISLNWVSGVLERRVGNGVSTHFWLENWIGGSALCEKFPRLFSLSEQKEVSVSDVVIALFVRHSLVWRRAGDGYSNGKRSLWGSWKICCGKSGNLRAVISGSGLRRTMEFSRRNQPMTV